MPSRSRSPPRGARSSRPSDRRSSRDGSSRDSSRRDRDPARRRARSRSRSRSRERVSSRRNARGRHGGEDRGERSRRGGEEEQRKPRPSSSSHGNGRSNKDVDSSSSRRRSDGGEQAKNPPPARRERQPNNSPGRRSSDRDDRKTRPSTAEGGNRRENAGPRRRPAPAPGPRRKPPSAQRDNAAAKHVKPEGSGRREGRGQKGQQQQSEGSNAAAAVSDGPTAAGSGIRGRNSKKAARDYSKLVAEASSQQKEKTWEEVDELRWGKPEEDEPEEEEVGEVQKPNFGLSGKLMEDTETGNTFNGVTLKWSEPPEARKPTQRWRFYVFKGDKQLDTLHIHRQSAYLVGREPRVADIPVYHPSISKQHAVIQFRLVEESRGATGIPVRVIRPYIMDLETTNGTKINGEKIKPARYTELREKDMIKFGNSSRDYVILHDKSG